MTTHPSQPCSDGLVLCRDHHTDTDTDKHEDFSTSSLPEPLIAA